uniref:Uncharacterized protein n=1 Tax=Vespula pensylvanica TaxID=30213 RepID=A0A834N6Q3_VESPE|nr:hypothetical protein H0235_016260 [Vespula pensylvanica]
MVLISGPGWYLPSDQRKVAASNSSKQQQQATAATAIAIASLQQPRLKRKEEEQLARAHIPHNESGSNIRQADTGA